MAKSKQYAAGAEARGGSSSQDEGEEESESESASESECEEKEVENEEQEHDEDQDEGEEGSSSESESECEEKQVEKEEQDEGEEGSASESESECEEKDENTIPAPLPKKPSSGAAAQHPQSSSSSSSSESDSSPVNHCGVDPNMKMMQSSAAASASASAKNKKPTSKKPICNPTLKRLVVESESENRKSKRAKAVKGKVNVNADGVDDRLNKTSASKKVFFQRLWSAEDEIVILQGIIKYTADTGLDPSANINAFYLSIKNFIHVHVTKTQLCDKVRKLKQKYMTNATKAKLHSNSHDQQLYDLSQKIWGFQTTAVKLDTTNDNKDVVHGKPTLKEDVSNKMAEIKREVKKLQISQFELLRSTQLICEQTKRVLESLQ